MCRAKTLTLPYGEHLLAIIYTIPFIAFLSPNGPTRLFYPSQFLPLKSFDQTEHIPYLQPVRGPHLIKMIENLSPQTIGFIVLAILYFVFRALNATDTPKIKNLPEIPGIPIFGNLLQLGENHAKVAASWVKKYGPVFQVRLGNRRIVFANTFDSVRHLWITNQSSLISRPTLYTFHSVVSSSQGFTIGTSPWDESCKARRKAAASALNRPAVQSYMPIIDLESCLAIRDLAQDGLGGAVDIDPRKYFHRFALNTSLTLNYGIRIDGGIDQELLREG